MAIQVPIGVDPEPHDSTDGKASQGSKAMSPERCRIVGRNTWVFLRICVGNMISLKKCRPRTMDDLNLAVDDVSRAMSLTFEKCPGDVLQLALPEAGRVG